MDTKKIVNDTICAISTPAGVGGIAVVRVSGPRAVDVVSRMWHGKDLHTVASHTAHLGMLASADGSPLDQAVLTYYKAPASFTGDDVIELSVHGSRYIQQQLVNTLIEYGCRLAEPGEFTRRAFSAGKLDLAQAEAVADVIASQDRASHRIAMNQMRGRFSSRLQELRQQLIDLASLLELELDFSEEDVEFVSRSKLMDLAVAVRNEVMRLADSFRTATAIKNGVPVAIIGATNAGKSSLLNQLLGDDRAIVSDIHGTTRDVVEDTLHIGDYTFRLMDTAGLRKTDDEIESLGIERSRDAARRADIILLVVDGSNPRLPEIPDTDARMIVVVNKDDKPRADSLSAVLADPRLAECKTVALSAKTGAGLDELTASLQQIMKDCESAASSVLVANARHYEALLQAGDAISRAIEALKAELSGDLIALDIRLTITHLSSILGDITSQDLLTTIFSRFCIGK